MPKLFRGRKPKRVNMSAATESGRPGTPILSNAEIQERMKSKPGPIQSVDYGLLAMQGEQGAPKVPKTMLELAAKEKAATEVPRVAAKEPTPEEATAKAMADLERNAAKPTSETEPSWWERTREKADRKMNKYWPGQWIYNQIRDPEGAGFRGVEDILSVNVDEEMRKKDEKSQKKG